MHVPIIGVWTGSEFERGTPWIWNGSKWLLAVPYMYNGSSWESIGGDGVLHVLFNDSADKRFVDKNNNVFLIKDDFGQLTDSANNILTTSNGLILRSQREAWD